MWKNQFWVFLTNFQPKISIWVTFKKRFDSLSRIQKKKEFNSLSHIQKKKVQFFEPFFLKVQFFESYSFWKRVNSMSHIQKGVQLFDSFWKKFGLVLKKEKSSSLSYVKIVHMKERCYSLRHIREKKLFLWVVLEISILWVEFKKKSSMSKKKSHIQKKDQFCESYCKKKISSVSRIRTSKKNILRVIVQKKGLNSLSLFFFFEKIFKKKKVQVCES